MEFPPNTRTVARVESASVAGVRVGLPAGVRVTAGNLALRVEARAVLCRKLDDLAEARAAGWGPSPDHPPGVWVKTHAPSEALIPALWPGAVAAGALWPGGVAGALFGWSVWTAPVGGLRRPDYLALKIDAPVSWEVRGVHAGHAVPAPQSTPFLGASVVEAKVKPQSHQIVRPRAYNVARAFLRACGLSPEEAEAVDILSERDLPILAGRYVEFIRPEFSAADYGSAGSLFQRSSDDLLYRWGDGVAYHCGSIVDGLSSHGDVVPDVQPFFLPVEDSEEVKRAVEEHLVARDRRLEGE